MTIPTLHTDRLVLRGPEARDWPGFRDYFLSERSVFTGGPYDDTKKAWILFAAELGHWALHDFGMWTATLKDDQPIGLIGCWYPEGWPEKEIGWLLWDGFEGQGYASEAARTVRAHCYGPFGWTTAVSYIHRDNVRSIALAERLGCTRDLDAVHPNPDALVYRHPAPSEITP